MKSNGTFMRWVVTVATMTSLILLGVSFTKMTQAFGPNEDVQQQSALLEPAVIVDSRITYQGLLKESGAPVTGSRDMVFNLYTNNTCTGVAVQSIPKPGVTVSSGLFSEDLDVNQAIFSGQAVWLAVSVTGTPIGCEELNPVPYALSLRPGAQIQGVPPASDAGLLKVTVDGTYPSAKGVWGGMATGSAIYGNSTGGYGVYGYSSTGNALRAESNTKTAGVFTSNGGYGIQATTNGTDHWDHAGYFSAAGGYGIYAKSSSNMAIRGEAGDVSALSKPMGPVGVVGIGDRGVWGSGNYMGAYGGSNSVNGYGGYFENTSADGIGLQAQGDGSGRYKATLRAGNTEQLGGMAAYLTNGSNYHNAHFYNSGTGGVLYLQNGGTDGSGTGGGEFITAVNESEGDVQFRVTTGGNVYADGVISGGGADFAEMLPAADGLNPGDVLIIGQDGKLALSTQPYQSSIVGVYSTKPGFVGGQPVEGTLDEHIPLAIVGIVPVKASAENGVIVPGDLLVASSTPGHAMKAGPNPPVGTVIGKALQVFKEDKGVVQMLVTLQ